MGKKSFPLLGERLKALRTETGLTQAAIAATVGVKHNTYSQWESGARFPESATLLASLCRLYGCSSDYLLGLSEERGKAP